MDNIFKGQNRISPWGLAEHAAGGGCGGFGADNFPKEVAQNRPPHFLASTFLSAEIVSDQISGDEGWMKI
jgi:hypothetical protein